MQHNVLTTSILGQKRKFTET
eukprot:UN09885